MESTFDWPSGCRKPLPSRALSLKYGSLESLEKRLRSSAGSPLARSVKRSWLGLGLGLGFGLGLGLGVGSGLALVA